MNQPLNDHQYKGLKDKLYAVETQLLQLEMADDHAWTGQQRRLCEELRSTAQRIRVTLRASDELRTRRASKH